MRRRFVPIVILLFTALAVMQLGLPSAGAKPARCDRHDVCTPESKLRWSAPVSITSDVQAGYSSIDTCPGVRADDSPLRGARTVLLQIAFSAGGSAEVWLPVAPDGTWTTSTAFGAPVSDPDALLLAECFDAAFTVDEAVIALYRPKSVEFNT